MKRVVEKCSKVVLTNYIVADCSIRIGISGVGCRTLSRFGSTNLLSVSVFCLISSIPSVCCLYVAWSHYAAIGSLRWWRNLSIYVVCTVIIDSFLGCRCIVSCCFN